MEKVFKFRFFLYEFKRNILAIVIAAVIGAGLFGCYHMIKRSQADNALYCSYGQIYLDNNEMITSYDVDSKKLNNFTEIYSSIIKSDIVLSDAISKLEGETQLTMEELRKRIVVVALSEEIIEVNVFMESHDATEVVLSEVINNTLKYFSDRGCTVEVLSSKISRGKATVSNNNNEVVVNSNINMNYSMTSLIKHCLLGCVLGGVFMYGLFMIIFLLGSKLRYREQFYDDLNIKVINDENDEAFNVLLSFVKTCFALKNSNSGVVNVCQAISERKYNEIINKLIETLNIKKYRSLIIDLSENNQEILSDEKIQFGVVDKVLLNLNNSDENFAELLKQFSNEYKYIYCLGTEFGSSQVLYIAKHSDVNIITTEPGALELETAYNEIQMLKNNGVDLDGIVLFDKTTV